MLLFLKRKSKNGNATLQLQLYNFYAFDKTHTASSHSSFSSIPYCPQIQWAALAGTSFVVGITPKQDKSRHIAPNRASGSPVLRTFAVAKVLPLGLTDKKRFIARHSLKRTFVT